MKATQGTQIPFITAYGKKNRITVDFDPEVEPSLAQQNFKEECDINNIVKKFERTGLLEHANRYDGQYGDFTSSSDYQTSLNQLLDAQEAFDNLPARIRSQFNNDPAQFLDFVHNPDNHEAMYDMGLATRPAAPVELPEGSAPRSPNSAVGADPDAGQ